MLLLGLACFVLGGITYYLLGLGPLDDRPPRLIAYARLAVLLTAFGLMITGFVLILTAIF